MTESKEIANYYIERYRKTIGFANKALAVALLILIVNWLFSIEPGYQAMIETRQAYKNQLKETEKQLNYFIQRYYRYYNKNAVDSETYISNLRTEDTLQKTIAHYQKINSPIDYTYLEDSLDRIEQAINQYKRDSADQSTISLLKDSISHVKQKRIELEQAKSASLNENLKDYDWKSLIKFIFIVAGNPRDGSLYLMGLITLMLIFGLTSKRISLYYLAKGLRIYKLDTSLGINSYQDFSIPTPFWLSPLPVTKRKSKKFSEGNKDSNITKNDLSNVLGFNNNASKYIFLTIFIFIDLLLLQLRFFYISIHSNTPIHFDFSFSIAVILFLSATAQVIIWIYPAMIDDHLNYESIPNNTNRRLFITYGFLTLVAVVLLKKKNEISKFYGLNAKRYIKKQKQNEIKKSEIVSREGLYFRPPNLKDRTQRKIIYFFNDRKYSLVLKLIVNTTQLNVFKPKLISIKNSDFSLQSGYRFNRSQYSWHTENYTLSLLKHGEHERAINFIFEQVVSNNHEIFYNYRILDLAVKMFVRLDKTNNYLKRFLNNLDEKINNSDNYISENFILRQRFYKWNTEKWVNKIKGKKVIVYNDIKF